MVGRKEDLCTLGPETLSCAWTQTWGGRVMVKATCLACFNYEFLPQISFVGPTDFSPRIFSCRGNAVLIVPLTYIPLSKGSGCITITDYKETHLFSLPSS